MARPDIETPSAWVLLKRARERVYTLPEDFPGFRGTLALFAGGLWHFGRVEVQGYSPKVDLLSDLRPMAERELASLLGHRRPVPFPEGEGKYPMRLFEEGPLGTGIALEDPFRSRIWVKGNRLQVIERHLAGGSFRIHLEVWREVEEGLLPQRFLLVHRDPEGRVVRVERFRDEYQKVGPYWLPVEREVVVEARGLEVLVLRLEELEVNG
ncbi:DUF3386 family protein [Thermus sp.]|uniref:DUF3386 family protein n=1 Tax=Thermus sp. TaxID=275 RepID=UPI0025D47C7D|nr:DUF3386 family protein [Thermus sp.]MCS6869290.1 DUF3386 domain-containing protein [Thermus sp.]MDW8358298.1 DUF3386 family protein [Thermus sp.]